eukprot:TRINITY_DN5070_c0_g1_i1.p1 TRINITY_DN5070_c0_g1~~TRINITY_DN5070_c0_g1_i1.p1  ORF type:complete len:656 (+),score=61.24 TRINITY_DN5070_c0_g1_i1:1521-3488(+)
MTTFSKLNSPTTKIILGLGSIGAIVSLYNYSKSKQQSSRKSSSRTSAQPSGNGNGHPHTKEKIGVDLLFCTRLIKLLGICVPGIFSKEMGFVFLVSASMVLRTMCDLWIIRISTSVERSIIGRDPVGFRYHLFRFFVGMIPVSLVNSLLRYSLSELALRFRTRLTNHLYNDYMKGFVFYRLGNLDTRIPNPDQLLTQDVEKFTNSLADMFSNLSKPLLDMVIFSRKLSGPLGAAGPVVMLSYLALSGVILNHLRRPLGKYTVEEQKLEGEFRTVNSRLISHSEEVAFYGGNDREKSVLGSSFFRLVRHLRKTMQFRFVMGIADSIITKYFATVVGFIVMSKGFLYDSPSNPTSRLGSGDLMEEYYRNGRMLMSLSMAMGRLVLAGRELTRLAGFTARVTELCSVLQELNRGEYSRTMLESGLNPNSGIIITQDNLIKFDEVPLVTPNGDVLIRSLSFEVPSGRNVLVSGGNGTGKSSLFRILGELWPLFGGVLTKPAQDKLFYVPQRPYMTLGTLRDQILYPFTVDQAHSKNISDRDLLECLRKVQLDHLVDREGGFDAVQDWMDKLSGGEKQRIAMARLFIHRPQFAILDECTSAVSIDVEGNIYKICKEMEITLFTVSHRRSLWKYHEYVLSFDGRGSYEYRPIKPEEYEGMT